MSYNLPGVKSGLKLDGPTIANIFLGKIKTWNDPAIKLNPGMSLPSTAITVVHRSDSSGTTDGLHDVPRGLQPDLEVAGRRRQGRQVADRHRRGQERRRRRRGQADPGRDRLRRAGLRAGERLHLRRRSRTPPASTCLPTIANTSAAADGITVPPTSASRPSTRRRRDAYPIVSQTFLDAYKDPCKAGGASSSTASGLKKFLTYAFGAGQQTLGSGGNQLPYAPLPAALVAKDKAQLQTMTCNGSPIS